MDAIINYIVLNKDILIVGAILLLIVFLALRGIKRIAGAVLTIIVIFAMMSFIGFPFSQVHQDIEVSIDNYETNHPDSGGIISTIWDTGSDVVTFIGDSISGAFNSVTGEPIPDEVEDVDQNYLLNVWNSVFGNTFLEFKNNLLLNPDAEIGEDYTQLPTITNSVTPPVPPEVITDVEIHFIDVGQADCILVIDEKDTILIDSGNYADADLVTEYLSGLGIVQIDYFILTHPHEDHIGSAATVLRNFDVENIIKTDEVYESIAYDIMMEEIANEGANVITPTPGNIISLNQSVFQILGPIKMSEEEPNNNSVVIRYSVGSQDFLFTGDAEREEELDILDAGFFIESEVLKVGHHGSSSSTSYPWLRAIMPEYAVIPCGVDNDYGHPHDEVTSRLNDAEVTSFRADINGTVVMITDGQTIDVSTEK